jgi:hypothetical protein
VLTNSRDRPRQDLLVDGRRNLADETADIGRNVRPHERVTPGYLSTPPVIGSVLINIHDTERNVADATTKPTGCAGNATRSHGVVFRDQKRKVAFTQPIAAQSGLSLL